MEQRTRQSTGDDLKVNDDLIELTDDAGGSDKGESAHIDSEDSLLDLKTQDAHTLVVNDYDENRIEPNHHLTDEIYREDTLVE